MTTFRRRALQLFALVSLFGALTTSAFAQAPRGPSTPEERARVVKLADESRKDPLAVHAADGAWLEQWINDVPDYILKPEAVAMWCKRTAKGEMRKIIQFQYSASAMGYQIKHNLPEAKTAPEMAAVDLAGLDGVLAAYEVLLAKDEANRSPKMDEAVARRNKGELAAFALDLKK